MKKESKNDRAFYAGEAEKRQLHRILGEVLPSFMIPNVFVKVLEFPVTKNGKIDRKRLMEFIGGTV